MPGALIIPMPSPAHILLIPLFLVFSSLDSSADKYPTSFQQTSKRKPAMFAAASEIFLSRVFRTQLLTIVVRNQDDFDRNHVGLSRSRRARLGKTDDCGMDCDWRWTDWE
ncbi:hypothetical protein MMC22_002159 [Lobaria immixta]|nr:hypothetical protein [Lobaria immixta]